MARLVVRAESLSEQQQVQLVPVLMYMRLMEQTVHVHIVMSCVQDGPVEQRAPCRRCDVMRSVKWVKCSHSGEAEGAKSRGSVVAGRVKGADSGFGRRAQRSMSMSGTHVHVSATARSPSDV